MLREFLGLATMTENGDEVFGVEKVIVNVQRDETDENEVNITFHYKERSFTLYANFQKLTAAILDAVSSESSQ